MQVPPLRGTVGLLLLLCACGGSTPEPPSPPPGQLTANPDAEIEAERSVPEPPTSPPRGGTEPPADDALACAGFPFAPDDGVRRCAASEAVDGVAVEKAWVLVPGRDKGHWLKPDDPDRWWIVWTLLLQTPTGWVRAPLYRITCGGEVPVGCSHDEMFRRSFEVARNVGRIAVVALGADGRFPIGAFAMLVEDAPPFIFPASEPPASAKALLDAGPADLEAAYRQQLATGRPFEHALAAADAGVPGARDLLGGLLASEADWSCRPLFDALRTHPGDRWVEEQLTLPSCGRHLVSPT